MNRLLLDAAPESDLEWQDFDHVATERDNVERVLKGALASGEPGVNVLLYGEPGTGKTEFSKVLARRLGLTLYAVGEADEDGDEPSRHERLRELRLSQRLLAGERRSLILFDEMEDLLSEPWGLELFGRRSRAGAGGSKVYLNRLLEEAPAPTLWTANDAHRINRAFLRRFMVTVEMRLPSPAVRERIWARQLSMNGIEASADEARMLATDFEATPGVAAGVTAAARLAGGDIAAVRRGRAQPIPPPGMRPAAAGDAGTLRPCPRSRGRGPRNPGGPPGRQRRTAFLPVPAGAARNRQERPGEVPGGAARFAGRAETRL